MRGIKRQAVQYLASLGVIAMASNTPVYAQTAGDVLEKLSAEQRNAYMLGVVEGLAFARWMQDRPDATGMQCIYSWFLNDPDVIQPKTERWFARHPDKRAGHLLYTLIKQECGG